MGSMLQQSLENGVCFNFKLPEKGLCLRSVSIDDGVPLLSFDASNSSELVTITEEDVAIIVRLVAEKKRPEFFYIAMPPNHPFSGRQYKQYSPQWLRGTSVGELLSEVDWEMKCLTIGAKTNDDKTVFSAASNTSKLTGRLGTCMDFPSDKTSGSVKMSCKSVKVERSNDDLVFVGEPKMQIVDDTSPAYTKYITKVFDSVAYYDQPMFLRMKEMIKLILAMEFLNERGVRFDREWLMEKTANKNRSVSQTIKVPDSEKSNEIDYNKIVNSLSPECSKLLVSKVTESGIKFHSKEDPETTIAISVNDYDLLYDGSDPKQPIAISSDDDVIVPDVDTWNEVHNETVPWPRIWSMGKEIRTAGGGVTTRHIPTAYVPTGTTSKCSTRVDKGTKHKGPYEYFNGSLSVSASTIKTQSQEPPKDMIPTAPKVKPTSKVGPTREVTPRNGDRKMYGFQDEDGMEAFDKNGNKVCQIGSTKLVANGKDEDGNEQRVIMKRYSLDSGIHTPSPSSTIGNDTITEMSDSDRFSTLSDSTPRYDFCSPIGSGDEMD